MFFKKKHVCDHMLFCILNYVCFNACGHIVLCTASYFSQIMCNVTICSLYVICWKIDSKQYFRWMQNTTNTAPSRPQSMCTFAPWYTHGGWTCVFDGCRAMSYNYINMFVCNLECIFELEARKLCLFQARVWNIFAGMVSYSLSELYTKNYNRL